MPTPHTAADWFAQTLQAQATPERAIQEKRYLKSTLQHYGASVPAIDKAVRQWLKERGALGSEELWSLVDELWGRGVHELRMVAVELLSRNTELLLASDLPRIETLLRQSRTWALVDGIAPHVLGRLLQRLPELPATLDRWAVDQDFWLRRAVLLTFLLPMRRGEPVFGPFAAYADAMLEEGEFFIRKAIGWVLRERAKVAPEEVFGWLLPRVARASGLTLREAGKYLSPEQKAALTPVRRLADLGEPLAYGATAELYARGPDWVLKLFKTWMPWGAAEVEATKAGVAYRSGVPTARVGERLQVGDRAGLLYQRLHGPVLTSTFFSSPEAAEEGARLLAELHLRMHEQGTTSDLQVLPTQKASLAAEVRRAEALDDGMRQKVLAILDSLPTGNALCHGDFHPDNVILTPDGPKVIDWPSASRGHPLGDVAQTVLLLRDVAIPLHIPNAEAIETQRSVFTDVYLDHYLGSRVDAQDELGRWRVVAAAARLALGGPLEQERLLQIVRSA